MIPNIILFIFLLLNTALHAQDESAWVSISNEYVTVSMDSVTGRYIVYDTINYHPPANVSNNVFPSTFLTPASPPPQNSALSPILGNGTNAFNVTSFNIDGTAVVFGSREGRWASAPRINSDNISYTWSIGALNIVQNLTIVTNPETLFPDAVQISYDVFNNYTNEVRRVQARMVLDTIANDGQSNGFFLANSQPIVTEYAAPLGTMPEFWLTSDGTGFISILSLKGFSEIVPELRPQFTYFTTIDKALADKWEYNYSRNNRLADKDLAVLLYFQAQNVDPLTSKRIASMTVGIPSLYDTIENNGLEVRTSSFTSSKTTPVPVTLWVQNDSGAYFDTVELDLQVPSTLKTFDLTKRHINDFGSGKIYPVTWNIGTDAQVNSDYNISVNVKGYKNGVYSDIDAWKKVAEIAEISRE